MAELIPRERLQPSLLDRLTDDEPDKLQESRARRVMSMQKLREVVLRDLAWLLNAGSLAGTENLEAYPLVAASVLNYGLPDLAGHAASNLDIVELERLVRQVIWDFEPRLLRHTVKVRALTHEDQMNRNAICFEIEGELWAQPMPLHLLVKAELDLENGSVTIADFMGRGTS